METSPKPSVAARVALAPIRFYQRWISPALPPTCRFYPSCSEYAVRAIQIHGVVKGVGLAVIRLLKCGPWHPGGVDHVPPRRRPRGEAPGGRPGAARSPRAQAHPHQPRDEHPNPQSTETHA